MSQTRRMIILGCGGHARSVADVVLSNDPDASLLFVDANAREGEKLFGFDVVKSISGIECPLFIGLGDNLKRKEAAEQTHGSKLVSVVSKKAHLGHGSLVGPGCFVGSFCHVGPQAEIGRNTILNTSSVIEHEVRIGDYCHIGPNATVLGRCAIGDLVTIGAGATVKNYVNICSNVVVGAGSAVINDITDPGTYAGCPAKKIR